MVEVTNAATMQIAEYFKDREVSPVRIFLDEGGWGGPSFGLALDELRDTDVAYDIDGFTYVADKNFIEKVQPIKIDFNYFGFKITSEMDLGGGCSSCTSAGSCCSW